jgi:signal transduction histidine kinase
MVPISETTELRVLVLASLGRDAELTAIVLREAGLCAVVCQDIAELCEQIGHGAGVVVLAEEALAPESVPPVGAALQAQPPWSDLPFVVLTSGGRPTSGTMRRYHLLEVLGNITLLERPVRTITLVSSARAALRSRRRQYELREHLAERGRTEEALVHQAEQLARSNTDLQQFAYVTSHDLQEPLRTIASFSQILARRYKGRLDKDADEFINFITSGVFRMQMVIEDLLSYSRLVNQPGAKFAAVPLTEAVDWARQNLGRALEESGGKIICGDLPVIEGDRVELVQLFQNLLSNAIKYRRPDIPLEIRIVAERREHQWVLGVQDNGMGFDSSYSEHIFALFKRLHGSAIPGTGIGLTICRKIVERHGGRIWAESQPGAGASFYFTFPHDATASGAPGEGQ